MGLENLSTTQKSINRFRCTSAVNPLIISQSEAMDGLGKSGDRLPFWVSLKNPFERREAQCDIKPCPYAGLPPTPLSPMVRDGHRRPQRNQNYNVPQPPNPDKLERLIMLRTSNPTGSSPWH